MLIFLITQLDTACNSMQLTRHSANLQ